MMVIANTPSPLTKLKGDLPPRTFPLSPTQCYHPTDKPPLTFARHIGLTTIGTEEPRIQDNPESFVH